MRSDCGYAHFFFGEIRFSLFPLLTGGNVSPLSIVYCFGLSTLPPRDPTSLYSPLRSAFCPGFCSLLISTSPHLYSRVYLATSQAADERTIQLFIDYHIFLPLSNPVSRLRGCRPFPMFRLACCAWLPTRENQAEVGAPPSGSPSAVSHTALAGA